MTDVNKSKSYSEVEEADSTTKIPSGDEHNKCRKALANEGAGVNVKGEDGLTALMFTVKENHPQCLNELIKAGANVNAEDSEGFTALFMALGRDVDKSSSRCEQKR